MVISTRLANLSPSSVPFPDGEIKILLEEEGFIDIMVHKIHEWLGEILYTAR